MQLKKEKQTFKQRNNKKHKIEEFCQKWRDLAWYACQNSVAMVMPIDAERRLRCLKQEWTITESFRFQKKNL